MGNKQKSRAKLEAKRRQLNRLYWFHGFYSGKIRMEINGNDGDLRLPPADPCLQLAGAEAALKAAAARLGSR